MLHSHFLYKNKPFKDGVTRVNSGSKPLGSKYQEKTEQWQLWNGPEQGGHFPVEPNGGIATSELPPGLAEIINVKALNPAHPVAGHLSDVSLSFFSM